MTKKEREQLTKITIDSIRTARQVLRGELWADVYTTQQEKEAFLQGIWQMIDPLVNLLGIWREANEAEEQ